MNPNELDALQRDSARLHDALWAMLEHSPTGELDGFAWARQREGSRLRTDLMRALYLLELEGDDAQRTYANDTLAALASHADDEVCFRHELEHLQNQLAAEDWGGPDAQTRLVATAENLCILWERSDVDEALVVRFDHVWKGGHVSHGKALQRVLRLAEDPHLTHLPIHTTAPRKSLRKKAKAKRDMSGKLRVPWEQPPPPLEDWFGYLNASFARFRGETQRDAGDRIRVYDLPTTERRWAAKLYGQVYQAAYPLIRSDNDRFREDAEAVLGELDDHEELGFCFSLIVEDLHERFDTFMWDAEELFCVLLPDVEKACAMAELGDVSPHHIERFNDVWIEARLRQKSDIGVALHWLRNTSTTPDAPLFTVPRDQPLYPQGVAP